MDETLTHVKTFHDAFGVASPEEVTLTALEWSERNRMTGALKLMREATNRFWRLAADHNSTEALRLQLIAEELTELTEALVNGDPVECLDALCDLRYVLDGTVLALGMGDVFMDAFREVQRSNMSKLGEDGRPIHDEAGRVVKGPNYSPPDLRQFIIDNPERGEG